MKKFIIALGLFVSVFILVVSVFALSSNRVSASGSGWVARTNVARNWQSIASNWDGTKLAAVVWGGYIYTSTDSGLTWVQRTTVPQNWKYITSSGNGTKLTAVINGGISYYSTDSGVTWLTNGNSNTHIYFSSVASEYDGDQVIATSGTTGGDGIIYTSTTGGAYFNVSSAPSRNWRSVAASSKYATNGSSLVKLVAAAWDGYIYTSANFGASWTPRTNVARKWQAVVSDWTGNKLVAAVYGGYIYTSTDGGATWTPRTTVARNWYALASSDDGSKLVAAVENGYIYTSTDGGITWTEETGAGSHKWHSVTSSTDGSKLVASDYGGYIYTRVQIPTIITQAASSVTASTATLNGNITLTEGGNVTLRGFNYGTTTNYGTNTSEGGSFSAGAFSKNIPDPYKNINCGTTYHYRSYATNSGGTGYGSDQTFTTSACTQPPPVVYTSNASNASANGMKLSGGISSGANITTRGFEVGTDTSYGIPVAENGSFSSGVYSLTATTLACGTRYHYRRYAINNFGTGYGNDMTASTNACTSFVPTLTTQAASLITKTTTTLNGNITGTGGQNVTLRGFEVGQDTNYGIPVYETGSFNTGAYTKVMVAGLSCGTTYHYRSYAKNRVGNGYGNDQTFTTSSCTTTVTVPALTTQGATAISTTGVTLTGTITSIGGANITTRGFNYGTTTSYGTDTIENGSFNNIGAFTKTLTNLVCGTTYHFRGYATNSAGTGYGIDRTFTTNTCTPGISAPTTTTSSATSITATGAILNGSITATGGSNATIRGFNYGTTTSYGTDTTDNGSYNTGAFTKSLTSLTCGTTYHFRSYATNSAGTGYGNDMTFITSTCVSPVTTPTLTTEDATAITNTGGTLNGTITGGTGITEKGFQYGITTDYGASTIVTSAFGTTVGTFSKVVVFLTCGNTYHFRSFATNSMGTGYGNDETFTVNACPTYSIPTLTTDSATSITKTTATLNATVTSLGGAKPSAAGFQYGLDTNYGTDVSYDAVALTARTFSKSISDLTCETTYHYQSYITNSAGTGYGNDQTLTTSSCLGGKSLGGNALSGLEEANGTNNNVIANTGEQTLKFTRNLSLGMVGDDIKALQVYLNTHGYVIATTGEGSKGNETTEFGKKTKSAVILFQKANDLLSDGIVGFLTTQKMK